MPAPTCTEDLGLKSYLLGCTGGRVLNDAESFGHQTLSGEAIRFFPTEPSKTAFGLSEIRNEI